MQIGVSALQNAPLCAPVVMVLSNFKTQVISFKFFSFSPFENLVQRLLKSMENSHAPSQFADRQLNTSATLYLHSVPESEDYQRSHLRPSLISPALKKIRMKLIASHCKDIPSTVGLLGHKLCTAALQIYLHDFKNSK